MCLITESCIWITVQHVWIKSSWWDVKQMAKKRLIAVHQCGPLQFALERLVSGSQDWQTFNVLVKWSKYSFSSFRHAAVAPHRETHRDGVRQTLRGLLGHSVWSNIVRSSHLIKLGYVAFKILTRTRGNGCLSETVKLYWKCFCCVKSSGECLITTEWVRHTLFVTVKTGSSSEVHFVAYSGHLHRKKQRFAFLCGVQEQVRLKLMVPQ